ncbi:hypothetical protein EV2_004750 [Malus domestica]
MMPSHSQLRCITIFFVTFLSDSQASILNSNAEKRKQNIHFEHGKRFPASTPQTTIPKRGRFKSLQCLQGGQEGPNMGEMADNKRDMRPA